MKDYHKENLFFNCMDRTVYFEKIVSKILHLAQES